MPANTLSHIDLSVSDLDRSEHWYAALLDAKRVLGGTNDVHQFAYRYLKTPGGLLLGLIQHAQPQETEFSPRRVGLDHLSFAVETVEELDRQQSHLDTLGIPHSGIVRQPTGDAIAFRDPDGIQLEFYWLAVRP
ncbi:MULTISPECIES: VOC family protein [Streptomyces]|uniref:VOC family protein n=1 Tax=Streptomyces fimbriatus TaxID=68197 RepID=A0ABW0DD83_STRFI